MTLSGSLSSTTRSHGLWGETGHKRAVPSDGEGGTPQPAPVRAVPEVEPSDSKPKTRAYRRKSNIVWTVAVVLVALLAVYAFGGFGSSPGPTYGQTTSTTYDVSASAVVQAAAQQSPAGYTATTLRAVTPAHPGAQSAAYAILNESQSLANMTVIVFGTTNSTQSYYNLFASHVVGLPGYTNITSVLDGYEQYGRCYGYGEDVDGIAVANGICADGNVFLQAHLSSTEPFSQLEADLSSLMGAMYQSVE